MRATRAALDPAAPPTRADGEPEFRAEAERPIARAASREAARMRADEPPEGAALRRPGLTRRFATGLRNGAHRIAGLVTNRASRPSSVTPRQAEAVSHLGALKSARDSARNALRLASAIGDPMLPIRQAEFDARQRDFQRGCVVLARALRLQVPEEGADARDHPPQLQAALLRTLRTQAALDELWKQRRDPLAGFSARGRNAITDRNMARAQIAGDAWSRSERQALLEFAAEWPVHAAAARAED